MYQQLRVIEDQPAEANPLGSVLVALVKQLSAFTSMRLTAHSGFPVQASPGSVPPATSLVKRIEALRRLLAELARIDPRYAHRLAPTLAVLESLLAKLRHMQYAANPLSPVPAAATPDTDGAPVPSWPLGTGTSLAATGTVTAAPLTSAQPMETAGRAGSQSVSGTEHQLRPNPRSASTNSTEEPVDLLPAGGPSPSVGAPGSGAGTGAGTLATTSVVILLLGLLSGRLGLVVLPRRLAVFRHRLERPG